MEKIINVLKQYHISLQDMYNSFGSDELELVYSKDGIELYYATDYGYMDIIGLTDTQWKQLRKLMGEIDHLEFNDTQIPTIIVALKYQLNEKLQWRKNHPFQRPLFDYTNDDSQAIPLILNKILHNKINECTDTDAYIISSAVDAHRFNNCPYDSEEYRICESIERILKNYKSYLSERRK